MDIGWQQEVNIADSPIETGTKAPGPVLARPQYLVHVGKRCVDRPLRQRRETGYCSTFSVRVASSVGASLPRAAPALFGRMRPHLRLCFAPLLLASPTHVALSISRPIAEFEHVFSFASGFIRADLHKHDTVQSSNNNHKILWSVCAIIETSKPGFSQGKTQAMLSLERDEGPDSVRIWGI